MAAPFDAEKVAFTGPPMSLASGVRVETGRGGAQFALSRSGLIAFAPGAAHESRHSGSLRPARKTRHDSGARRELSDAGALSGRPAPPHVRRRHLGGRRVPRHRRDVGPRRDVEDQTWPGRRAEVDRRFPPHRVHQRIVGVHRRSGCRCTAGEAFHPRASRPHVARRRQALRLPWRRYHIHRLGGWIEKGTAARHAVHRHHGRQPGRRLGCPAGDGGSQRQRDRRAGARRERSARCHPQQRRIQHGRLATGNARILRRRKQAGQSGRGRVRPRRAGDVVGVVRCGEQGSVQRTAARVQRGRRRFPGPQLCVGARRQCVRLQAARRERTAARGTVADELAPATRDGVEDRGVGRKQPKPCESQPSSRTFSRSS